MKCLECGENCTICRGAIEIEGVGIGKFKLRDVTYWECGQCNERILPAEAWKKADTEEKRILNEKLSSLPVKEYVSASEATKILGVSRQALHKHKKINKGFVYSIVKDGRKFYHKGSLELFINTGDGRFNLSGYHNPTYLLLKIPVISYTDQSPEINVSLGSKWKLSNESRLESDYAK